MLLVDMLEAAAGEHEDLVLVRVRPSSYVARTSICPAAAEFVATHVPHLLLDCLMFDLVELRFSGVHCDARSQSGIQQIKNINR